MIPLFLVFTSIEGLVEVVDSLDLPVWGFSASVWYVNISSFCFSTVSFANKDNVASKVFPPSPLLG